MVVKMFTIILSCVVGLVLSSAPVAVEAQLGFQEPKVWGGLPSSDQGWTALAQDSSTDWEVIIGLLEEELGLQEVMVPAGGWDSLLTWVDEQVDEQVEANVDADSDLGWDNFVINVVPATPKSWDAPVPKSKTRPSLLGTCQVRRK